MALNVLLRMIGAGFKMRYAGKPLPESGRCWEIWLGSTFFILIWEDEFINFQTRKVGY